MDLSIQIPYIILC